MIGKDRKIPRPLPQSSDPTALALSALGWVMADDQRATRFLSLTGLTPDELRARLTDPTVHCAVLDFLGAHEPDLIAAAGALEVPPTALAAARHTLSGSTGA